MRLVSYIKRWLKFPSETSRRLEALSRETENVRRLAAKQLISNIKNDGIYQDIRDAEFKVYSQWGDDGIIQYLINNIEIPEGSRKFVEFGVQNYLESTTRFLLVNDNWEGLIMDSSSENIEFIKNDEIYWRHDLKAICAFVDTGNINALLSDNGFSGEVGLLHIDIDGNDYWVWDSITAIDPIIAVIEYNSVFGPRRAVTVPYDPAFDRTRAHHSNLYFGASLKALYMLAQKKGYCFVGTTSSGNNAYFIRNDKVGKIRVLGLEEGFTMSRARESRDIHGKLSFISGPDRLKAIGGMDVFDVEAERLIKLSECL